MTKLHLPARPANEGARRLAHWLLDGAYTPRQGLLRLHLNGVDRIAVDRMLSGELLPGADYGAAVMDATGGAVRVSHWYRDADGAWGDPVVAADMARAA